MNIIRAIETGLPFKREDWTHWLQVDKFGLLCWTLDGKEEGVTMKEVFHIVAEDWVIASRNQETK